MMSDNFKDYKLSKEPDIFGMVVIVTNITKQFHFTTNTNISALFPTEGRKEYGAMKGFHSSFPAKDFIPLTVNNYKNVFLDILRACCFDSNVFLYSVAWFSYFLDITTFFKHFMLHFSCFCYCLLHIILFFISL